MGKSCLIIDEMHESIVELLEKEGFMIAYQPEIRRNEILEIIGDFDGVIIRSKTSIDKEFLEAANKLKFIARAGAGVDQIDVTEVERRNIKVVNAPEGNRDAVGEHTVGMLLTLFNKLHLADRQVKDGIWDREGNRGHEIMGKTIGLIGYGHMGNAVAQRLSGFACEVIAYDKYKENFSDKYVKEVGMNEIFSRSEVVSFHVPLTHETKSMINDDYLSKFKKNIYLINTARGEILVLEALKRQLEKGKILGAGLDVLEYEKYNSLNASQNEVYTYLKTSNKILFTPHVAGWSHESYEKISQVLYKKIKKLNIS
ncbi:NAD(P)-dependent oxidoreductase [Fulvivirgaceae bacterium BMA10]|uniref:NAD(P)-dependent oxidoreductase n=1 Tax=Splendidivirga corallicola TaxID=3051826 RepID=A0ABT8KRV7_9BACT|nr:NAD(P)-dependent oxidoreductase [Fulvivirgaceae bacterium BMA10]